MVSLPPIPAIPNIGLLDVIVASRSLLIPTETDELKASIREWIESLGGWPHGHLAPPTKKTKEVGRMLLLQCECGLKIRTTQKWIDEYGPEWPCPCGSKLIVPITEEDD